jgi:uncharacterized iron-regulated membrane protein
MTSTGKSWLLGLLGVGAAGTGYVIWRRHRAPAHRMLGAHEHRGHKKHGNQRGEYGHKHHKEHGHG